MKNRLIQNPIALTCAALQVLFVLTPVALSAAGFTEPPAVLYGKIIHVDQGATYQVFSGQLRVVIVNENNALNRVTLETPLGMVGENGDFSFRLEIPQKYLPVQNELSQMLSVGNGNASFQFATVTVDGVAAEALDSAQSLLATSFSRRGSEHRLDLKVNLPQLDSDGDGMPDWWENLHGLNPFYAGDALSDFDGDGWTALQEFQRGTNPNENNAAPAVSTTSMLVPIGGRAGFYLNIQDADTTPQNLWLSVRALPDGVTMSTNGTTLKTNTVFTYADVLAGRIELRPSLDFVEGSLLMNLEDRTAVSNNVSSFQVLVKGFSPATQLGLKPAVWLDAQKLASSYSNNAAVSEWRDGSGNQRDAYQPYAESMPQFVSNSFAGLSFGSSNFAYLDERDLRLAQLTAFFTFAVSAYGPADQTIFNSSDLRILVGGDDAALDARSLRIRQNGREVKGPVLGTNQLTQITLTGGTNCTLATVLGGTGYRSASTSIPLEVAFATLGAKQGIVDLDAVNQLRGVVCEMLLYDRPLDPGARSRHEDYQLSRWSSLLVWDYRDETAAVKLTGAANQRNSLNGGWGNDVLIGGNLSDILRGGPGTDTLTGGGGADRFQFFKNQGNDIITDFTESEGDIIDLTPIFSDLRGSPDSYVAIRSVVTRDSNNVPRVNAILDLSYNGNGVVDESITLQNQRYTQGSLRRLVGEGIIQLGGPQFDTTISITATETNLIETEVPRTLTITRTGNLEAALNVDLTFVGAAEMNVDYSVWGGAGSNFIRNIVFARGESVKTVDITPIQDTLVESEDINVGVLGQPQITLLPAPLKLSLNDAPAISIQPLQPYARRIGQVPGLVAISRSGPVTDALDVSLQFGGSATNSVDYATLSPVISFPVGVRTVQLVVQPASVQPQDRAAVAQISLIPDVTRYALMTPWTASVLIMDGFDNSVRTFSDWQYASGNVGLRDPDLHSANYVLAYVYGSDPARINDPANRMQVAISNGIVELRASTASGLSDVNLVLQSSSDLVSWQNADALFNRSFELKTDGRLYRTYRSKTALGGLDFYRLGASLAESSIATFAEAIGQSNRTFLACGGPVWLPSASGTQINSPQLAVGQASKFSTWVSGPFSFQWTAELANSDYLTISVDGVETMRLMASTEWVVQSVNVNTPGLHEVQWKIQRENPSAPPTASIRQLQFDP